jgi:hypothetical protein
LFAQPAFTLYTNYGVIPAEQGFEASSSGGILASFESSTSFTGRFESFVHIISPRLQIGRELGGLAQRAPLPDDAPEYLFTRVENFNWGVLQLTNTVAGDGWSWSMPVGVVASGDDEEFARPRPWLQSQLSIGVVGVSGSLLCDRGCGQLAGALRGWVWGRLGRVSAEVGYQSIEDMRTLWFVGQLDAPSAPVAFSQPGSEERVVIAQFRGEKRFGRFIFDAHTAATEDGWVGAYGGAGLRIPALGFGVRAGGGWDHGRESWTASVGLVL